MKLIFLFFLLSNLAYAQDLATLFRPGPSGHSGLFRETIYGDAKVSGERRRLQQREWQGRVAGSLWSNEQWELTAGIEAQDLILNNPNPVLDNNYRSFQGSLGARRFGTENKIRGFNVSYGSASDRPFARASNDTASATYLHQVNGKWWALVNWSNNRTFLNNVPLPGVFYVAKMSLDETLLFGFPAVVWRKRYESGLEFQYFSFLPFNHKAQVGWFWNMLHGVTLSYEHRPQVYFRDERIVERERLFFVEQRAMLELQGAIIPRKLQWQLGAGTAFNRSVYESENFSEDKRFDIPLGDTWLASGQLTAQF